MICCVQVARRSGDKQGVTNDMTKDRLNDLIEYLKTLKIRTWKFKDADNDGVALSPASTARRSAM